MHFNEYALIATMFFVSHSPVYINIQQYSKIKKWVPCPEKQLGKKMVKLQCFKIMLMQFIDGSSNR